MCEYMDLTNLSVLSLIPSLLHLIQQKPRCEAVNGLISLDKLGKSSVFMFLSWQGFVLHKHRVFSGASWLTNAVPFYGFFALARPFVAATMT